MEKFNWVTLTILMVLVVDEKGKIMDTPEYRSTT